MRKITRKATSIVKKGALIALAILCMALFVAAVITLSRILFRLFCFCLAIYIVATIVKVFILPLFKKK